MINYTCPKCGREHDLDEALAGLRVLCKTCYTWMQLPPAESRLPSQPKAISPATSPRPAPEKVERLMAAETMPVGGIVPTQEKPPAPQPSEAEKLMEQKRLAVLGAGFPPITAPGDARPRIDAPSTIPTFFRFGQLPPGTIARDQIIFPALFIMGWLFVIWSGWEVVRFILDGLKPQENFNMSGLSGEARDSLENLAQTIRQERRLGTLLGAAVWLVTGTICQAIRLWGTKRTIARWQNLLLLRKLNHDLTPLPQEEPDRRIILATMVGAGIGFFFGPPLLALPFHLARTAFFLEGCAAISGLVLGPLLGAFAAARAARWALARPAGASGQSPPSGT
jgi:hypothetical protein